jgi:hypothetical protein
MPALVAGIHNFLPAAQVVDARHKAGHDEKRPLGCSASLAITMG